MRVRGRVGVRAEVGVRVGVSAARRLPLGEGASSTKGPEVSSWSCASLGVRVGVGVRVRVSRARD